MISNALQLIPLVVALVIVLPFAFSFVRTVLEKKMEFDILINLRFLRFLEAVLGLMLFPTAVIMLILYGIIVFAKQCYKLSRKFAVKISRQNWLRQALFQLLVAVLYLAMLMAIAVVINGLVQCLK